MLNRMRGLLLVPEVEFVRIAHLGTDLKRPSTSLGALLVVTRCDTVSPAGRYARNNSKRRLKVYASELKLSGPDHLYQP